MGASTAAKGLPAIGVAEEERIFVATQWQLMWWKFRKHKLAMLGGIVTILIYLVAIFAEFLSPVRANAIGIGYRHGHSALIHCCK